MSFSKAQDLIHLAQMAAAKRRGISLDEIKAQFDVSHRTAQRMTEALETVFPTLVSIDSEDRRKRWRLESPLPETLQPRQEITIEALEIALRSAREQARLRHVRALEGLRDKLLAKLPPRDANRSEVDADAVLASLEQVTRPGPTVALNPKILNAIIESLRGPFRLRIIYGSPDANPRIIEPHGLLLGYRSYLVAYQPTRDETMLNFRMDRIYDVEVLEQSFIFESGFKLKNYASLSFGVYQDSKQYGEVIWHFAPDAAKRAAEFCFHPTQSQEFQKDGSLIVRFTAAGWLEMTWYLYQWGNKVEVIAPEGLRLMVEGYQRSDFASLP